MDRDRPRPSLGRAQGWDPVWQRAVPPTVGARLAPVAVFAVALAAYARTLLPGLAFGDRGELQTVPAVLGIAHAPGYPSYVLAARLFELLPLGSVAYRANLFSAVLTALALATLSWTAVRLGVRPAIAAGAALATGAVGTVWASATVADVSPLHLLLMALLLDRSLAWADRARPADLALCGLLTGLALGNVLLTLFVAPFLALFALWSGKQAIAEQPLLLFLPIATLALGLVVYAYIPLAARLDPPLAYNHPTTLDAFLALVTGAQERGPGGGPGGGALSVAGLQATLDALPSLLGHVLDRGAALLPVAGAAGLAVLLVRRPALALALVGVLLAGAHAWANGAQPEPDLLVPFLVLGLGAAVALEAVARAGSDRLPSVAGQTAGPAAAAAGLLIAAVVAMGALPAADRSGDRTGDVFASTMAQQMPQHAAVFSFWAVSTPLWHAQLVTHERPDVLVVDETNIAFDPGGTREERIASLVCRRPVLLIAKDDADLAAVRARFALTAAFSVADVGSPAAAGPLTVYRVGAPADTCS
jgi:hypothetical protein